MNRLPTRIRVVLFFAFAPQLVGFSGVLAQRLDLQPGDKAQGFMNDPFLPALEGSVTETWDGGFEIEVRGESTPRRVDVAGVSSLQRSRRLGGQARKGALMGGAGLGSLGFLLGYCVQILSSSNDCAEDLNAGLGIGLVFGAAGALLGAGIGALRTHYGPFEAVDLEGSAPRSSGLDRVSVDLLPYPDGRIGLGVTLSLGGGR